MRAAQFLSTLSLRRATLGAVTSPAVIKFLSTLSLRRATAGRGHVARRHEISIHALLAESDRGDGFALVDVLPISIHALLAESDFIRHPTPISMTYFYPRSPCGERRVGKIKWCCSIRISIHALLAESDVVAKRTTDIRPPFLSTLSLRRATKLFPERFCNSLISIHALLAESDRGAGRLQRHRDDFYPRSPCGERRGLIGDSHPTPAHFYPRSPCGERLLRVAVPQHVVVISIHALLAESDHRSR